MSWLNLNESLNSLKGQITNFASEVLSEGVVQDSGDSSSGADPSVKQLEDKCRNQQLEIASLKKLNEELQTSLHSERLSKKNGIKEEESSWYWDPPPPSNSNPEIELYKQQIHHLQNEISTLKERGIGTQPEIEEEVIRLREENNNLTTNLEDLDTQHQLAMERLLTLKKELQKNFEVLKQEHEDLKNSNDEYAAEIQSLLIKIGERDEEIKHLSNGKSDLETVQHKYMNLEKVHSLLKENVEKFQEENQDLHEEIFKLQEQVTKLEHELELTTKHAELSSAVPKERYDELLKELHDLKERRKSSQIYLDEINIDDNAKSVIENLKRDIKDLKHKLTQKEESNSDNRAVQCDKFIQLYNKYVNFDLPVDYVGEIPSSDDNICMFKLEAVFKTLNSYKKDINALEHKLSEKNHDINHMQTQIDDLTAENEFLTTDVRHFEREFNEMKKNNDFLISEIAALKNVSKLEPIIETHEDNLAKLETELADSNRMNKTFESEIQRIEKELAEVQSEKKILKASLNDLRFKYTAMLEELENCKSETKMVADMEHTANADQTEHLQKATDEIDELKKRLSLAHAKNEQLSIDIHIIENDKVLLTKKVDDLKHALEEKNTAHEELKNMKLSLNERLLDLELRLNDISKHKHIIEKEKVELENKFTVLQKEASAKSDSADITAQLQTVTTEKDQLLKKLNHTQLENTTLQNNVETLKNEIFNLRKASEELQNENNSLKNCTAVESKNNELIQQTIDELKAKIVQQQMFNTEISSLKDEKQKILERKLQLEGELSATDSKIMHLEEDFEKLVRELNEKDVIIDTLNSTIAKNNMTIAELNQNVTDLSNSTEIKNQEIQRLRDSFKEAIDKLNETTYNADKGFEELQKLQSENQEINKQVLVLNEELGSKNIHISALTNRVEELEKNCPDHKAAIDVKDKQIKELNQSIVELTDKVKSAVSVPYHNDDYAKLVQEKESYIKEIEILKNNVTFKEKELSELKAKSDQIEKTCLEYKTVLDNSTKEKTELINLVNLKHNESIQYHNEVQRLNTVLFEQSNEFKRVIEEKDNLIQNQSEICANCERLKMNLQEKDNVIMVLNQNSLEYERMKVELQTASDTIRNLTEKCESLDKSLSVQLEAVKNLTTEHAQLSELEQNSTRELERLRHHLLELEESYTQDLMTSEQKLTECQTRLHQVEERAKQTSTVYTSNSIRANQEVETLRNQIKLLEKQREDVQAKLSEAEDAKSRSEAALTNLQVVLEQFQLDKERDIHSATEKIRNKMEDLKRENNGLRDEIAKLNAKLEESLAGLQAATRLGDQVETKTAQINDLKEQVRTLQTSVAAAEERYYNAISNQQDKIDKNLVKNLVINYVMTAGQNVTNKTQVLRVLSTVLDFNQQECERLGLVRAANNTDSLAAEFVKFLQNESRPRAPLPNIMGLTQGSSRSTTPTSRKSSVAGSNPDMGHKRNPSTGSNNLLFQNLDALESTSQISMDLGVNQTRDNEGAILKHVLRDM